MRAIVVERLGGPEVLRLREVPDPIPGSGEVLVDVDAAGVLWVDTAIRRGSGPPHLAATPPYVPGGVVAGTVGRLGHDVPPGLLGTRIAVRAPGGGYAERVTAPAASLVPVPDGVGLDEAAALLGDGATALALLERTPVYPGEDVLIVPAAGGVGTLLVQVVSAAGGRVVAGVRGARRQERVRALGAAEVLDHSRPGWVAEAHALLPDGPHVVFDGVGGQVGRGAAWLARDGGRYSSYGIAGGPPPELGPCEEHSRNLTVAGIAQLATFAADAPRRAREILARAAAGTLHAVIGAEYPLAEAPRAHADLERRRSTGKILLRP